MSFYIAQRNAKTGRLELLQTDGETKYYSGLNKAIDDYTLLAKLEGMNNVLLLQEVDIIVSVEVNLRE